MHEGQIEKLSHQSSSECGGRLYSFFCYSRLFWMFFRKKVGKEALIYTGVTQSFIRVFISTAYSKGILALAISTFSTGARRVVALLVSLTIYKSLYVV